MAIISFGQTFRGSNDGFALTNTTANTVVVNLLGVTIQGLGTEVVNFDMFDAYVRSPRHPQVYEVRQDGTPYGTADDMAQLGALINNGTLVVKAATLTAGTNTFTVGASSAGTACKNSVFFS
jgi:hypothetical protein